MDYLEIKEFIKDFMKYVILVIFILFLIMYVVTLTQVIGPSMEPNFNQGDILMLDKVTYRFSSVKRGDVISFSYSGTKYLIKRVIGLPGESVEIKDNKVYINGMILEEYYLTNSECPDFSITSLGEEKVPIDSYFVMGDNRSDSLDSRDINVGFVKKEDIEGKIRMRIWPLNRLKLIK